MKLQAKQRLVAGKLQDTQKAISKLVDLSKKVKLDSDDQDDLDDAEDQVPERIREMKMIKLNAKQRLQLTAAFTDEERAVRNLVAEIQDCMTLILDQDEDQGLDEEQRRNFKADFNSHLRTLQQAISKACGVKAASQGYETKAVGNNVHGSLTVETPSGRLDVRFDVTSYESTLDVIPKNGKRVSSKMDLDKPDSFKQAIKNSVAAISGICS